MSGIKRSRSRSSPARREGGFDPRFITASSPDRLKHFYDAAGFQARQPLAAGWRVDRLGLYDRIAADDFFFFDKWAVGRPSSS